MFDAPLLLAILLMVAVAMFFGMLLRDIMFAWGAASWSARAFSRAGLARGDDGFGVDWDEENLAPLDGEMPLRHVSPRLAWALLRRRSEAAKADLLPYQRWLASFDETLRRADERMASA